MIIYQINKIEKDLMMVDNNCMVLEITIQNLEYEQTIEILFLSQPSRVMKGFFIWLPFQTY